MGAVRYRMSASNIFFKSLFFAPEHIPEVHIEFSFKVSEDYSSFSSESGKRIFRDIVRLRIDVIMVYASCSKDAGISELTSLRRILLLHSVYVVLYAVYVGEPHSVDERMSRGAYSQVLVETPVLEIMPALSFRQSGV